MSTRLVNGIYSEDEVDRLRGCLLGLAVGDAVGTTVEFKPRGTFVPVENMVGGGPFDLQPGQWTDDTSMALCLASSLVEKDEFHAEDQMLRYVKWRDEGYLSSKGYCFDIGNTVRSALNHYEKTGDPYAGSTDEYSAGNGSIMRLAPIPMFYYPHQDKILHYAGESSRTTHGAHECLDACRLMSSVIHNAVRGQDKQSLLIDHGIPLTAQKIISISQGGYLEKTEEQIRGSGYVVECLEAALWCFHKTTTFKESILAATNLGDDADTTAAVCGQIAGAFYGESAIPKGWIERLYDYSKVSELADALILN